MRTTASPDQPLLVNDRAGTRRRPWVVAVLVLFVVAASALVLTFVFHHDDTETDSSLHAHVKRLEVFTQQLLNTTQHQQSQIEHLQLQLLNATQTLQKELTQQGSSLSQELAAEQSARLHNVTTLGRKIVLLGLHSCTLTCANGGHADDACEKCIECNAGWVGDHCELPESCSSKGVMCYNGGQVNATSCHCICPPNWDGPTCNTSVSTYNTSALDNYIARSLDGSNPTLAQAHSALPLSALPSSLGCIVAPSGEPMAERSSLFRFTYNSSKMLPGATGGAAPVEADFDWFPLGTRQPEAETRVYPSVQAFRDSARARPGDSRDALQPYMGTLVAASKLQSVLNEIEQLGTEVQVSVQYVGLYALRLRKNPSTGVVAAPLSQGAAHVLQLLRCDEQPHTCVRFFQEFGFEFVTGVLMGGMRLHIQPHVPGSRQPFASTTSAVSGHLCWGGTTTLCTSSPDAWVASLRSAPVVIKYRREPLSVAQPDPHLRAVLANALQTYLGATGTANPVASTVHRCPSSCSSRGSCSYPTDEHCSCTSPWTGRTCNTQNAWVDVNVGTSTVVPAFSCPNYIGVTLHVTGYRGDSMGTSLLMGVAYADGKPLGGGTTACSLGNPAMSGMQGTKSGGDGYGWWYGGVNTRFYVVEDPTQQHTISVATCNSGFSESWLKYTVTCH